MGYFRYDRAILERFPDTRAGVIYATRLANGPTPVLLQKAFGVEQRLVLARIGDTPLSEIPSLAAWRRVFSGFGARPTKYRNAAEALARRLNKRGDIPSINLLVDIANLISIRYGLPIAVFDQSGVAGGTTVRFADGTESFTDLGSIQAVAPEAGEVVFVDELGIVSARRWCWRQSDQSAAGPETTEALITIEGQHPEAEADVAAAVADLLPLLASFQPAAAVTSTATGPEAPSFTWD